jgi:GntR family transcriptional repressor for pyruvate dehydrogenase complex
MMKDTNTAFSLSKLGGELGPIRRVDLTEEIISRIKMLLARGKLKPGDKLPSERELARILGVGRIALRHALKSLTVMGIIKTSSGQRSTVNASAAALLATPIDFLILLNGVTISELFELRKALEVEIAGLAAERATEQELAQMELNLKNQEAHLNNPELFLMDDFNFHNVIAAAAHNVLFTAVLESLTRLMIEARRKSIKLDPDASHPFSDHLAVYREIAKRSREGARQAMFRHIDRVHNIWEKNEASRDMPEKPKAR